MSEFQEKQQRIHALLDKHNLEALLLQRVSSFAWATCGARSYINTAASDGVGSLLITRKAHFAITNNIEAERLEREEGLGAQGWEFRVAPWHEPNPAIEELTRGLKLGSDGLYPGAVDLSGEVASLRANLLPEEGERFRELGRICAAGMDAAIRKVRPGQTEQEIAGLLAGEVQSRGAQPIVNLIATDERISAYRHPLPTDKKLERYAMLVLCGRKYGLVCSVTRFVHFGKLPDELRKKEQACAYVDATFIAATRPGTKQADIFQRAVNAYAESGFAGQWQFHHQGGPAGYEPREWVVTPAATELVRAGEAYAWNPSITGAKSEDTFLVGAASNEVVTTIEGWPSLSVELPDGQTLARPGFLEVV